MTNENKAQFIYYRTLLIEKDSILNVKYKKNKILIIETYNTVLVFDKVNKKEFKLIEKILLSYKNNQRK